MRKKEDMDTVDLINSPSDEIYGAVLSYLKRLSPKTKEKIYVSGDQNLGRFTCLSNYLRIAVKASSRFEAAVLLELTRVIINSEIYSLDDLIGDVLSGLQFTLGHVTWGGKLLQPGVYPIGIVLEDLANHELPNLLEYDIPTDKNVELELNGVVRPLHEIDIWDIDRIIKVAAPS